MRDLDAALVRARDLDVEELAAAIRRIGFECTDCGACCRAEEREPHTATVFPEEVRQIAERTDGEWRDVARPIPYGLEADGTGETFEWALAVDGCGDCTFLEESADGDSRCGIYADRPRICRTYPFQAAIPGVSTPQAEPVAADGPLRAYECEGLGREIDEAAAGRLAREVKTRAIAEIEEALALLEAYEPVDHDGGTVVYDSDGAKAPDGRPIGDTA